MPELPEVETIRSDLEKKIIGKEITRVEVKLKRLVKGDCQIFTKMLRGNRITKLSRRGKLLMASLQHGEYTLLMHLKMTGQLIYQKNKQVIAGGHSFSSMTWDLPSRYTYITITFADDSHLFFNDMRTFGYMQLVNVAQLEQTLARYGIEPLQPEFTLANFKKVLGKRTTSIKAALLNQSIISGIGNIYADETCFYAGVLPSRRVSSLTDDEIKKLHRGANAVIKKAIAQRGTTFSHFVDANGRKGNFLAFLKVFGRQRKKCARCKTGVIKKTKHAGRGTHFCSKCQS